MKIKAVLILTLFLTAYFGIGSAPDDAAYAISGCCKQRTSANDPWYRTASDLNVCKDLNGTDGDNIFEPSGKVWWDLAC